MSDEAIHETNDGLTEEQRLLKQQADLDLGDLLSRPSGRRFIWRVLQQSGYGEPTFCTTDRDTAFMCGKQSNGDWLVRTIEQLSPGAYARLQLEMGGIHQ